MMSMEQTSSMNLSYILGTYPGPNQRMSVRKEYRSIAIDERRRKNEY